MKHTECYRKDYYRPQFVRGGDFSLNGQWDFAFDSMNEGEAKGWYKGFKAQHLITVPFAYQSPMSGIGDPTRCDFVWYAKQFDYVLQPDKRLLLNFEGCDHTAKVWLNGVFLGTHVGGYARFTFDATNAVVKGKNLLVVKAEDSYSCRYPRGKQRIKDENHGCWYIDTTGLYKSVWGETVSKTYLVSASVAGDIDSVGATFEVKVNQLVSGLQLKIALRFRGEEMAETIVKVKDERVNVRIGLECEAHFFKDTHWSQNAPNLYDITYTLLLDGKEIDTVGSYFGMVKYRAEKNCINVNDTAVYLKMLLDQGYWQQSHLTPPDEEAILKDILLTLEGGFNGIRKHQKIEDERFYYYCDILGVFVWCEMPSMFEFTSESGAQFTREWLEVVESHKSHPCIMTWVPFNESWGLHRIHSNKEQQKFTEGIYFLTKALDSTRLVVSNDGWDHTRSDIITLHNYLEWGYQINDTYGDLANELDNKITRPPVYRHPFAEGYHYEGQPVMISEYGGIAFKRDGGKGWGYGGLVDDEEKFLERLKSVTEAIQNLKGVCGYCLTQTTDVQQEVNGVLTEDRQWKADVEKIKAINKGL